MSKEEPPNTTKRCKFLASVLKDAFAKFHSRGKLSVSSPETEESASDFDEEEEVFVSAIISKYMESKCRRKSTLGIDSLKWALSPEEWDLMVTPNAMHQQVSCRDNGEEFLSAGSRLPRCSSATSFDAFVSAKTCFSRSSSLNNIDFQDFSKRSIILELLHCEGWPFGLCRKALLLPPLPKSPSDSWSWRKSGRMIKIHG
ncbi:hypothetical protein CDL12_14570 [Handroanthus impetiginosus]|uniref:Uncharacterized protein n=1 Tax=Handroanthus impetiginosus TaxID=429701 RepID=A0A2G9H5L1_9LAMI|nr:hypothetical protein CDL12_14570 [Handroanthus impetiginosus]